MKKVEAVTEKMSQEVARFMEKVDLAIADLRNIQADRQKVINLNDDVVTRKTQQLADFKAKVAVENESHQGEIDNASSAMSDLTKLLLKL